jgi:hypothetical protein
MADYYPLLSKAVSGLASSTPEARQGIYERARTALARQLVSMDPPVAQAIIDRELAALDQVVRRIEDEQNGAPPAIAEPAAEPPPQPPRPQVMRKEQRGGRKPLVVVGFAVGLVVVMAIATLAFLRRNEPPATTSRAAPAPQVAANAPTPAPAKTEDRVAPSTGDAPARAPQPPASAPAPAPPPARPPDNPVPTTTAPPPAPTAQIAVANRMVLVLEGKEEPQKVDVRQGSVVWRTEMVSGGQGQPLQSAIRATIEVPEARLRAEVTIQRNRDPAFPASHTVQVQFSSGAGAEISAVQSLNQIEFRQTETQAGYALAGQGIAVMENVFLVALAQIEPALSRNVEMMRTRPLVYMEFQAVGGRRGAMVIEKGVSGQQAFDEAFRNWQ